MPSAVLGTTASRVWFSNVHKIHSLMLSNYCCTRGKC
jgi:hypothetical protein